MEQAANATTPDALHKAHQAANDAISQLKGVLDFDNPGKHPTANAIDTAPPAAPPTHVASPPVTHNHAPAHQPAVAAPSPAPVAPGPAAVTPPGAGGGH
jgi:hypothetical protein